MGSNVYAKFVDLEDFIPKLLAVASSADPISGPEREAFFDSEYIDEDEVKGEEVDMGLGRRSAHFYDIHQHLKQKLPFSVLENFELFISKIWGWSDNKHDAAFNQTGLPGWVLDSDEIQSVKTVTDFLLYLQGNKDALAFGFETEREYAGYDQFLYYLGRWVEIFDTAAQKKCGLLIYEL